MERLKYYLEGITYDNRETESGNQSFIELNITDSVPDEYAAFPYGIPIDITNFIEENCYCFYCKAPINKKLEACECDSANKDGAHLKACFDFDWETTNEDDVYITFNDLVYRESRRIISRKRHHHYKKILKDKGKHTNKEVLALYELQNHLCFYCGKRLNKTGKHKYHKDHYEPISQEGSNEIDNIVLTCPKCNMDKSDRSGGYYKKIMSKRLSDDQKELVREIHENVRRFRIKYSKSKT